MWGGVLPRLGDIYGPTVNLASRLVALTEPGVVLTDDSTAEALEDDRRFVLIPKACATCAVLAMLGPWQLRASVMNWRSISNDHRPNLTIYAGKSTDVGQYRDNNEDSMVVAGTLCVVADGMGGHERAKSPHACAPAPWPTPRCSPAPAA